MIPFNVRLPVMFDRNILHIDERTLKISFGSAGVMTLEPENRKKTRRACVVGPSGVANMAWALVFASPSGMHQALNLGPSLAEWRCR